MAHAHQLPPPVCTHGPASASSLSDKLSPDQNLKIKLPKFTASFTFPLTSGESERFAEQHCSEDQEGKENGMMDRQQPAAPLPKHSNKLF